MTALPSDFYCRDTIQVARQLLGKVLVRRGREGKVAGRIVEVEAYLHTDDPACHAARGCTRSNRAMFGRPGRAYVYPIHSRFCFNAVTEHTGIASAVLIRAVEPLDGVPLMTRRRGGQTLWNLARGPARLCEAFDVDRRLDHCDLTTTKRLWIEGADIRPLANNEIGISPRIGVSQAKELMLRFFVDGCVFVSGPRISAKNRPTDGKASHGSAWRTDTTMGGLRSFGP